MFFSQDWRERIKTENPDAGFGEVGKLLGAKWKELDEDEKKVRFLSSFWRGGGLGCGCMLTILYYCSHMLSWRRRIRRGQRTKSLHMRYVWSFALSFTCIYSFPTSPGQERRWQWRR